MKIAVISDIHANLLALDLAIQDARNENVDSFVFLGDYITDGENANEILNIIKNLSDYTILGNREKYMINYSPKRKNYNNYKPISYTYHSLTKNNLDYIRSLKDFISIEINNFKVLMIHGDQYFKVPEISYQILDLIISKYDFDICMFGHTHQYSYTRYKDKIFINPGSIGTPTDTPTYKYCIIEILDTIHVTLREFQVSDTFDELKMTYTNTRYYKENTVWAELILLGIRDGKDYNTPFIELVNNKLKTLDILDYHQFNKIWNDTYREYQHIIKEL